MKVLRIATVVALAAAAPVCAQVQCVLTANPSQLRVEGLAEPLGDVVLRCSGGTPFSFWTGSLQVFTSTMLANRTNGPMLEEVALAQSLSGQWQVRPELRARWLTANSFVIENVAAGFDENGQLGLRLSGVRAEAAQEVLLFISSLGNPQLLLPTPQVVVGRALGVSLGATSQAAVALASLPPPEGVDFGWLMYSGIPFVTTRVTEGAPAVFHKAANTFETGTRIIVRYQNTPAGAQVLAPAAVAGSTALQPTGGGNLGLPVSGGLYLAQMNGALLLSFVEGAKPDGSGGSLAFQPQTGINALSRVLPAARDGGVPYVVYEVLDSASGSLETAQFPAWIIATGNCCQGVIVNSEVSLAPVSKERGLSGDAPLPRFKANTAGPDCELLNDCGAAYLPQLFVRSVSSQEFTAASGSGPQYGYLIVSNEGGGLLRWLASAKTDSGGEWLRASPGLGVNRATVQYVVMAANLAPGVYTGAVTLRAVGSSGEFSFPVRLTVTAPLPPPEPMPVVRDVVKAGNRHPGPVAPGSLAIVLGENFGSAPAVQVGGLPAQVISAAANELLIEIPPALDPAIGRAPVIVDRSGRRSAPWGVEIAPVAPAVLFAVNEDGGERNTADNPVLVGRGLLLSVTGLALADGRVSVRIHDRDITKLLDTSLLAPMTGAVLISFVVPEDLPAMSTAVLVCGSAGSGPSVCAEPFDVFLTAP